MQDSAAGKKAMARECGFDQVPGHDDLSGKALHQVGECTKEKITRNDDEKPTAKTTTTTYLSGRRTEPNRLALTSESL